MAVFLPGYGQLKSDKESFLTSNPINSNYSPRLFGAPPQLTSLCDMRTLSSKNGQPGAVGDMYLNNILKNAQVANFSVGRALFTGGFNSLVAIGMNLAAYAYAYKHYGISGKNQETVTASNVSDDALHDLTVAFNERALESTSSTTTGNTVTEDDIQAQQELDALMNGTNTESQYSTNGSWVSIMEEFAERTTDLVSDEMNHVDESTEEVTPSTTYSGLDDISAALGGTYNNLSNTGLEDDESLSVDIDSLDSIVAILENLTSGFSNTIRETGATLSASLLTGLLVNQPFYTFEADWKTYINNVKMMINTAVIMLGLQNAYVRIGNQYMCVGKSATYTGGDDVWTLYRYITPDDDIGTHTSIDNIKGESSQYVSFMIDPSGESESYTNTTSPSQIYSSVINSGSDIGSEIAFITNSSQSAIDDSVIQLAGGAVDTANRILGALSGGVGKFTAAIAAGMARTYTGDHAIYPEIFKEHSSTQTYTIHIKLRASRGDPYTYLMDILVPLFHIMAMALPKMSKNSAASYQYPPLIQCNVPGMWGTRLGIIESLSIQKAPNGEMSVYGYPLSINVDVVIKDLMHAMVTTPMDAPALFLNNTPMFDYIAQCTGVDKYRVNSAARIITKIALAASFSESVFYNIGEAMTSDLTHMYNSAVSIAIK